MPINYNALYKSLVDFGDQPIPLIEKTEKKTTANANRTPNISPNLTGKITKTPVKTLNPDNPPNLTAKSTQSQLKEQTANIDLIQNLTPGAQTILNYLITAIATEPGKDFEKLLAQATKIPTQSSKATTNSATKQGSGKQPGSSKKSKGKKKTTPQSIILPQQIDGLILAKILIFNNEEAGSGVVTKTDLKYFPQISNSSEATRFTDNIAHFRTFILRLLELAKNPENNPKTAVTSESHNQALPANQVQELDQSIRETVENILSNLPEDAGKRGQHKRTCLQIYNILVYIKQLSNQLKSITDLREKQAILLAMLQDKFPNLIEVVADPENLTGEPQLSQINLSNPESRLQQANLAADPAAPFRQEKDPVSPSKHPQVTANRYLEPAFTQQQQNLQKFANAKHINMAKQQLLQLARQHGFDEMPFISYTGAAIFSLSKEQRVILEQLDESLAKNLPINLEISLGLGEGKTFLKDLIAKIYGNQANSKDSDPNNDLITTKHGEIIGYNLLKGQKFGAFFNKSSQPQANIGSAHAPHQIGIASLSLAEVYANNRGDLTSKIKQIIDDLKKIHTKIIFFDEYASLQYSDLKQIIREFRKLDDSYKLIFISATPNITAINKLNRAADYLEQRQSNLNYVIQTVKLDDSLSLDNTVGLEPTADLAEAVNLSETVNLDQIVDPDQTIGFTNIAATRPDIYYSKAPILVKQGEKYYLIGHNKEGKRTLQTITLEQTEQIKSIEQEFNKSQAMPATADFVATELFAKTLQPIKFENVNKKLQQIIQAQHIPLSDGKALQEKREIFYQQFKNRNPEEVKIVNYNNYSKDSILEILKVQVEPYLNQHKKKHFQFILPDLHAAELQTLVTQFKNQQDSYQVDYIIYEDIDGKICHTDGKNTTEGLPPKKELSDKRVLQLFSGNNAYGGDFGFLSKQEQLDLQVILTARQPSGAQLQQYIGRNRCKDPYILGKQPQVVVITPAGSSEELIENMQTADLKHEYLDLMNILRNRILKDFPDLNQEQQKQIMEAIRDWDPKQGTISQYMQEKLEENQKHQVLDEQTLKDYYDVVVALSSFRSIGGESYLNTGSSKINQHEIKLDDLLSATRILRQKIANIYGYNLLGDNQAIYRKQLDQELLNCYKQINKKIQQIAVGSDKIKDKPATAHATVLVVHSICAALAAIEELQTDIEATSISEKKTQNFEKSITLLKNLLQEFVDKLIARLTEDAKFIKDKSSIKDYSGSSIQLEVAIVEQLQNLLSLKRSAGFKGYFDRINEAYIKLLATKFGLSDKEVAKCYRELYKQMEQKNYVGYDLVKSTAKQMAVKLMYLEGKMGKNNSEKDKEKPVEGSNTSHSYPGLQIEGSNTSGKPFVQGARSNTSNVEATGKNKEEETEAQIKVAKDAAKAKTQAPEREEIQTREALEREEIESLAEASNTHADLANLTLKQQEEQSQIPEKSEKIVTDPNNSDKLKSKLTLNNIEGKEGSSQGRKGIVLEEAQAFGKIVADESKELRAIRQKQRETNIKKIIDDQNASLVSGLTDKETLKRQVLISKEIAAITKLLTDFNFTAAAKERATLEQEQAASWAEITNAAAKVLIENAEKKSRELLKKSEKDAFANLEKANIKRVRQQAAEAQAKKTAEESAARLFIEKAEKESRQLIQKAEKAEAQAKKTAEESAARSFIENAEKESRQLIQKAEKDAFDNLEEANIEGVRQQAAAREAAEAQAKKTAEESAARSFIENAEKESMQLIQKAEGDESTKLKELIIDKLRQLAKAAVRAAEFAVEDSKRQGIKEEERLSIAAIEQALAETLNRTALEELERSSRATIEQEAAATLEAKKAELVSQKPQETVVEKNLLTNPADKYMEYLIFRNRSAGEKQSVPLAGLNKRIKRLTTQPEFNKKKEERFLNKIKDAKGVKNEETAAKEASDNSEEFNKFKYKYIGNRAANDNPQEGSDINAKLAQKDPDIDEKLLEAKKNLYAIKKDLYNGVNIGSDENMDPNHRSYPSSALSSSNGSMLRLQITNKSIKDSASGQYDQPAELPAKTLNCTIKEEQTEAKESSKIIMQTDQSTDLANMDDILIKKMLTIMVETCILKGLNTLTAEGLYDKGGKELLGDKTTKIVKMLEEICKVSDLQLKIKNFREITDIPGETPNEMPHRGNVG